MQQGVNDRQDSLANLGRVGLAAHPKSHGAIALPVNRAVWMLPRRAVERVSAN